MRPDVRAWFERRTYAQSQWTASELVDRKSARISVVLPALDEEDTVGGDVPGKGEALWKGLAASAGEYVVFLDADLYDVTAGYVVGLLGPRLAGFVQPLAGEYAGRRWSGCRSSPGTASSSHCSSICTNCSGWTRSHSATWAGAGTTVRTSWPSAGWPARFSRHHPAPAVGHSSGVPGRLEMPCAISARR